MKAQFSSFMITREFKCTPALLFRAWADSDAKAVWFKGPETWVLLDRSLDFREGGYEVLHGRFSDNMESLFTAHYYDIVENERISFSYQVRLGGLIYSVSTAVVEISAEGSIARLDFTEQIALLDGTPKDKGTESRIEGTQTHFDRLERYLESF